MGDEISVRDSVRGPGTSMMGVAGPGASYGVRTSMREILYATEILHATWNEGQNWNAVNEGYWFV